MSASNYPPGVSDSTPDAPWNQSDPDDMDFDVTCSQTLSKTVTVTTNNYIPGAEGVDYESDDEGGCYAVHYHDDPDTSDTNWAEEYHDNQYHTPAQLLELFKQCLEENMKNGLVFKTPKFSEDLIKECEGWIEDETEYIKES
jgi:hypothetical protein